MDIDTDHKKCHASVPVKLMAPRRLRQTDEPWTAENSRPEQKIPPEEADNHYIKWTKNDIYILTAARRQQASLGHDDLKAMQDVSPKLQVHVNKQFRNFNSVCIFVSYGAIHLTAWRYCIDYWQLHRCDYYFSIWTIY